MPAKIGRSEMSRPGPVTLAPLETLFETKRGKALPLPPKLARLYGCLRMPLPRSQPHVFSNFVTTLDGVVSLNAKGHASGADISGESIQDRMVMGLLRAIADVVIVGSGTLGVDRRHVWTAEAICPELADDYRQLSKALGNRGPPSTRISLPDLTRPTSSRMALAGIAPARERIARISTESGALCLLKRFAPAVVVTISAGTLPDANTGKRRSISPLPLTITFSGGPRLPSAVLSCW